MTAREAAALTGRSETWLRSHTCAWCGETLLRAIQNGCGARSYPWPDRPPEITAESEDCKPRERRKLWWKP